MKLNGGFTEAIPGFKVVPQEPDEDLVQQQLQGWLEPGWCMIAPAGSASKVYRREKHRFWRIALILMLLWLLALVTR